MHSDENWTAKEFVKYEDVTDPKITRPADVIVRIGGAGVCRQTCIIVEGIWRSKVDVKLPYIMGQRKCGLGRGDWARRRGSQGRGQRHLSSAGDLADIVSHAGAAMTCTHWIARFPASTRTAVTRNTAHGPAFAYQVTQVAGAERCRSIQPTPG